MVCSGYMHPCQNAFVQHASLRYGCWRGNLGVRHARADITPHAPRRYCGRSVGMTGSISNAPVRCSGFSAAKPRVRCNTDAGENSHHFAVSRRARRGGCIQSSCSTRVPCTVLSAYSCSRMHSMFHGSADNVAHPMATTLGRPPAGATKLSLSVIGLSAPGATWFSLQYNRLTQMALQS